jgi:hypothetical protein
VGTKSGSLYRYNADLSQRTVIFENGYNVYSLLEDNAGEYLDSHARKRTYAASAGTIRNPYIIHIRQTPEV